jgi:hypothetical protein
VDQCNQISVLDPIVYQAMSFFCLSLSLSLSLTISKSATKKEKDKRSVQWSDEDKKCTTFSMFALIYIYTQRKREAKDEPNDVSCRLCSLVFILSPSLVFFYAIDFFSDVDNNNNNTKIDDNDKFCLESNV